MVAYSWQRVKFSAKRQSPTVEDKLKDKQDREGMVGVMLDLREGK
jgi:hypothetical protein